ncbi:hypothetical protein NKH77_40330 [Streptomyces sp. M19]
MAAALPGLVPRAAVAPLVALLLVMVVRLPWAGDLGMHAAVVDRLRGHLSDPGDPLVDADAHSPYYSPWTVALALVARATGVGAFAALHLAALVDLVLLLTGIRHFVRTLTRCAPRRAGRAVRAAALGHRAVHLERTARPHLAVAVPGLPQHLRPRRLLPPVGAAAHGAGPPLGPGAVPRPRRAARAGAAQPPVHRGRRLPGLAALCAGARPWPDRRCGSRPPRPWRSPPPRCWPGRTTRSPACSPSAAWRRYTGPCTNI